MKLITLGIFLFIVGITLVVTYWAAKRTHTTSEFYAAGGKLGPIENGFALAGDWMSAAAFLGFVGLSALFGWDGALYALGALVAFMTILLLIAEPLRNTGRYTLGDVIAYRMQRLDIPYSVSVVFVGIGMIVYVAFGGMLATTWVQIIKAVLLISTAVVLVVWILALFGFNPVALFDGMEAKYSAKILSPGNFFKHPLDAFSLGISFVLGTAGLPHIMTRFYTVPDAKTARKSVIWLMFLAGGFFLVTTLIGFASALLVGQDAIRAADKGGNLALPLLAQYLGGGPGTLGGQIFLAFVAAVAFTTILAVVAGLTLATSGAIAHDLYFNVIKQGSLTEKEQVRVARVSVFGIGIVAIVLGLLAQGQNVAVLVILAISIAASANFPIIVLSLFWRRFNTGGVIGGVGVGLVSAIGLALIGPAFMGKEAMFPIVNPAIVSMPLGFLGAVIGTLLGGRNAAHEAHFDQVLFKAQTGIATD